MITLYQYPAAFGLPNASPFCMKTEALLLLSGQDFEIKDTPDPRAAPKKKLPYIDDQGQKIADSSLIQQHLKTRYGYDPDAHLTAEQKAIGDAVIKMCEEHYYWCLVYSRWVDEANWPDVREQFFSHLPPVVRNLVPGLIRKNCKKQLWEQGMGRHSQQELYRMGADDQATMAALLGEKTYFLGDQLSLVDIVLLASIKNTLTLPDSAQLRKSLEQHDNLIRWQAAVYDEIFANRKV